jgi:hypothetical protein
MDFTCVIFINLLNKIYFGGKVWDGGRNLNAQWTGTKLECRGKRGL